MPTVGEVARLVDILLTLFLIASRWNDTRRFVVGVLRIAFGSIADILSLYAGGRNAPTLPVVLLMRCVMKTLGSLFAFARRGFSHFSLTFFGLWCS